MLTLSEIRDQHLVFLRDAAPGNKRFFLSGFKRYDELTGGFVPGELMVLGARPGMGKTSYAIAQALLLAQRNIPVLYYSLDMSMLQLYYRFFCQLTDKPQGPLSAFAGFESEFQQRTEKHQGTFDGLPIFVQEKFETDITELENAILEFSKKFPGTGFVIIDYIQAIRTPGMHRDRELSSVISKLKVMARTTGLPLLCLSQLSRAVETRGGDKRPQLSDLRESGSIEQEADKVIFLHRPEYYGFTQDAEGNDTRGALEAILARNKTGATGSLHFMFNDSTGSVREAISLNEINLGGIRPNETDDPF